MLKSLVLKNFKSWRNAHVEFAPLTAFFGANSSGKSSLLQFLLLLKQTRESDDRSLTLYFGSSESFVDLGTFKDVIYCHDENLHIEWRLTWEDDLQVVKRMQITNRMLDSGLSDDILVEDAPITIESGVGMRGKGVATDHLSYEISGARFSLKRKSSESEEFALQVENAKGFTFKRTRGRGWAIDSPPLRSFAFPDQVGTYFQNTQFLSDFELAYVYQMSHILHLGPLRDRPQRQYIWPGSSPVDVGRSGERSIAAILAATERKEMRNHRRGGGKKTFQAMIAYWLKEMNLIEDFQVKEISKGSGLYQALVKKDVMSPETFITDVGFGVSQILPVIVLLEYAPEGSTILLEQPEIHLHPAVQSALADLLLSAIARRKLQIILESHSEHLLHRLLRRVAEQKVQAEDLSLYFCENGTQGSHLKNLKVDEFGRVSNWPQDFFGDQMEDIAAREEAAIQRRMKIS